MFIVTEKAMRPASDKVQCFYCQQAVGLAHKPTCVLVRKKARARMVVEYEIVVPHSWDQHDIEFHRNEGSWCSDNAIDELQALAESEGCLCNRMEFEVVGMAAEAYLDE